jgi:hypothetical protein
MMQIGPEGEVYDIYKLPLNKILQVPVTSFNRIHMQDAWHLG